MRHIVIVTHHAHRINLILHQCDEGGDDNGRAIHKQSRQLVAERLAAARRHKHKCILPTKHILDDCFLVAFECIEAEITLQLGCEIDLIYIHHAVLVSYKDKTIWLLSKFITVFFSQKGVNRRFTKRKRGARNIFGPPS